MPGQYCGWVLERRRRSGTSLCVIKKPREWGGHRPHWAAEPEKIIIITYWVLTWVKLDLQTNRLMNRAVELKSSTSRRVSVFSSCQELYYTSPSGCALKGVGLRPLACWDCGLKFHRGLWFLSVVSVVCCHCKHESVPVGLCYNIRTNFVKLLFEILNNSDPWPLSKCLTFNTYSPLSYNGRK
jgi:hypothetical protein